MISKSVSEGSRQISRLTLSIVSTSGASFGLPRVIVAWTLAIVLFSITILFYLSPLDFIAFKEADY
jgi:hypothetical protein